MLENLQSGDPAEVQRSLENFLAQHGTSTSFQFLGDFSHRQKIWSDLSKILQEEKFATCHVSCLQSLKSLCRDKKDLDDLLSKDLIETLANYAGLSDAATSISSHEIVIEAEKCLYNIVFNSPKGQTLCIKAHVPEGILKRVCQEKLRNSHEISLNDLRILFLLTALRPELRPRLRNELRVIPSLLNVISSHCEVSSTFTSDLVVLISEILKIFCNLAHSLLHREPSPDQRYLEDKTQFDEVVKVIRSLLLHSAPNQEDLRKNCVDLLNFVPFECFAHLTVPPCIIPGKNVRAKQIINQLDMSAIDVLLDFLDKQLDHQDAKRSREILNPILVILCEMCNNYRVLRRYIRMRVLPPLKDVLHRPEEGTQLRNKLCQFLTSLVPEITVVVAEFLFILCKRDVDRAIKYTGYGNFAGHLANGCLLTPKVKVEDSTDSEDSDTEEYQRYADKIDPIVGCYRGEKPNPTEGMTEEQKEYEAVQLLNALDKLQRSGAIQPCGVDKHGRPVPVEHVLQLRDKFAKISNFTKPDRDGSDSDED